MLLPMRLACAFGVAAARRPRGIILIGGSPSEVLKVQVKSVSDQDARASNRSRLAHLCKRNAEDRQLSSRVEKARQRRKLLPHKNDMHG
jgi:hypothetical protein